MRHTQTELEVEKKKKYLEEKKEEKTDNEIF